MKKNKIPKGLFGLIAIIIMLSSVLAGSIFYGNNLTANAVKENPKYVSSHDIAGINDLSELNEGWYEIFNGNVFYLENFDLSIPIYFKVKNPQQQNGIFAVDADGGITFKGNYKINQESDNILKSNGNLVTAMAAAPPTEAYGWIEQPNNLWIYATQSDLYHLIDDGIVLPDTQLVSKKPQSTYNGYYLDYSKDRNGITYSKLSEFNAPVSVTLPDGTAKTTLKDEQGQTSKITFKTTNGRNLELSGDQLKQATDARLSNDFLAAAAKEGFSEKDLVRSESGIYQPLEFRRGDKVMKFNSQSQVAVVFEGDNLRTDYAFNLDGTQYITEYSGDVKNKDGPINFGKGSSSALYEITNGKKELISIGSTKDGINFVRISQIANGGQEIRLSKYNGFQLQPTASGSIILSPVLTSGPFSGMQKIESIGIDKQGKPWYYYKDGKIYFEGENGNVRETNKEALLTDEQLKTIKEAQNQLIVAKTGYTTAQLASQRFFSGMEIVFTQFRGLSFYTLFLPDKFVQNWRDTVDRAFAKSYIGTEYWTSSICNCEFGSLDIAGVKCVKPQSGQGVAYTETPQGLAQVGAHIEATRTEPIFNETNGVSYIYKITLGVRNGDSENDPRAPKNMSLNVVLYAAGKSLSESVSEKISATLFKENQNVGRGSSFTKSGSSSVIRESTVKYTKICLVFDQIPEKWKLDGKKLCNSIDQPPDGPLEIQVQGAAAGQVNTRAELNEI